MFIDPNYVFPELQFLRLFKNAICHNGKDFKTITFTNSALKEKRWFCAQEKEIKPPLLKKYSCCEILFKKKGGYGGTKYAPLTCSFFITFHFYFTISQKMFGSYLQEF